MGFSQAASSVSQVTQQINNVVNSTIVTTNQGCVSSNTIEQHITIGNISNSQNITLAELSQQVAQIYCVQTASSDVSYTSSLSNALSQSLQSSAAAGLTLGFSSSDSSVNSIATLINQTTNSVNISTLQSCIASNFNSQGVNIGNILNSSNVAISLSSAQSSVASCTQQQTAYVTAVNNLANAATIKGSSSSSAGFDPSNLIILLIIIGIIVLAFFLLGPSTFLNIIGSTVGAIGGAGYYLIDGLLKL